MKRFYPAFMFVLATTLVGWGIDLHLPAWVVAFMASTAALWWADLGRS